MGRKASASGIRRQLAAFTIVALGISAMPALAAVDSFIKIAGIDGESQDEQHKGEIDVLSWSWGMSGVSSRASSTNPSQPVGPLARACAREFTITKQVDKASPSLFANAATGTPIQNAVITVRKAGRGQQEFMTITLSNVVVSSVAQVGASDDSGPTESVSFNFSSVLITFTPQNADGSAGDPIKAPAPGSCP
ncbi:MAG TPA: type VI secretion system tube protein Hcp [Casimicrobiaceae bacterium]|nr:type VI secretion system tube protein Hcp [Casimicrobiaceae bacterium]